MHPSGMGYDKAAWATRKADQLQRDYDAVAEQPWSRGQSGQLRHLSSEIHRFRAIARRANGAFSYSRQPLAKAS